MQTKEFIKQQVKKFAAGITPEQFMELTEQEHSLIVLEVPINDYTLSEIARLVEDNNARVIRLEVLPSKDGLSLLVSLKLDIIDISAVLRSFERYSYNIIYYFMREGDISDTYEDRLKELLHYLDM
ncbi:MAG: hypothetical protein PHO84_00055 [Dysgonamonadaceae bacterium]|jgi:hypothetical protein|nr:hypothetical protein [Dysgonamonadaceae bacterium]MDD3355436.1 hypothetical protein [Dysgonamonadaceae bacterium]MDD3727427.1 hypothetical protein [Dysgonamonadaceae bacterium]MDD4245530.1 hypothetical protein [Dysgonamonadaceae bacterium]MDD4604799.1 hypothetical protein [Dysgonamonadaceae bacterium]